MYASVLPSKEKLSTITAPLLVVYWDKDQTVKPDQVSELESILKKLKKNVQVEMYAGAGHAFFNETGRNYNEQAAKDSWEKATKFFGTFLTLPKT